MKSWLIKKLGGVTQKEFDAFRVDCADFTVRYLKPVRQDLMVTSYSIYESIRVPTILVVGHSITVDGEIDSTIITAPWAFNNPGGLNGREQITKQSAKTAEK